jgi:hypothetical protein
MDVQSAERIEPRNTLAASVLALVEHAQAPLASKTVRVLLSVITGKEVKAEHLGRIAAYERERLLDQRAIPRLCAALKPDGTAIVPRVWCPGTWVLARRVQAGDAVIRWPARAAQLCAEVVAQYEAFEVSALRELALDLTGEALGRIFHPALQSPQDWQRLAAEMGRQLPGPGVAQPSVDQKRAAQQLDDRLSAVARYFGMSEAAADEPPQLGRLRVAAEDEDGESLIDLLRSRTRDEGRAAELATFLSGMTMLCRARNRPVSPDQYAELNGLEAVELRRLLERWQAAVPEEGDPQDLSWRLSRELRSRELYQLLSVRVHAGRRFDLTEQRQSIFDPLSGLIRFDEVETDLLASIDLERLRSVRLFGSAQMRFPAATTTLLEHAMRTAALAGELAKQAAAQPRGDTSLEVQRLARTAALLADAGRLPFERAIAEHADVLDRSDAERFGEVARRLDLTHRSGRASRALHALARGDDAGAEAVLAVEIAQVSSWIRTMQAASAFGLSRQGVVAPSQQLTESLGLDLDGRMPHLAVELRSARSRLRTELVEELVGLHNAEATLHHWLERDAVVAAADAMIARAVELWARALSGSDDPVRLLAKYSDSGLVDVLAAAEADRGTGAADHALLRRAAHLAQGVRDRHLHEPVAWTAPEHEPALEREEVRTLQAALLDDLPVGEDDVLLVFHGRRRLAVDSLRVRDGEFVGYLNDWLERSGMPQVQEALAGRLMLVARSDVDETVRRELVRMLQKRLEPELMVPDV